MRGREVGGGRCGFGGVFCKVVLGVVFFFRFDR